MIKHVCIVVCQANPALVFAIGFEYNSCFICIDPGNYTC